MSTFTSNFAPHIEAMLEWRTSLGHSLRDMRNAMTGFDRFCASHHPGETVLTRELATAWCRDTATGTWGAYRSRAVREFGKYLQLAGVDGFIVPSAWIASPVRGLPHMFTDEELAAFFRAADSIGAEYRSPFREYTIPVIFRLILGAGLRPPEARRLRRRDVDAEDAMVMIERSKRNKDRRVPVTGDLAGLLARFDHLADLRRPDREWFFEDQHGRQYSPAWLIAGYHRCCELAGGIAPASTPYTLRHNYATRTLMRWVEEGKDIEAWLPYLAAYMGHQKYSSTAWYVHLLPERLAATGLTSRGRHHPGGDVVKTRREAADGFYRHLREWFTAFLPRQRGAAENTITSCRQTWNMLLGYVAEHHHVAVEKVTFTMVDRATVTGFLDHMRATKSWTASTRNQRLACIRSFFTYAAAAEPTLAIYLADLAAIPRLNAPAAAPVKYMTTDAVTALLAAPDPGTRTGLRDQFFMILMYDLAARDAEMLALNLADIDTRRLTADLLGKGSKPRRLPITSETAQHFGRYAAVFHPSPEPATPMFYTVRSHRPTRMSDDNVARFIRQHAATAKARCPDVPARVHPHMLRHSRAMHLYQAGMPLALLTEWLGHADPETTLIYAHADTEMKRHALEKANSATTQSPLPAPLWHDREDIIQRLCGLKE